MNLCPAVLSHTPLPACLPGQQVTGGEAMYDQRLFNQDAGGAGAGGMGGEDSYNIYDKPLFADRAELFKHKVRRWAGGGGLVVASACVSVSVCVRVGCVCGE